MRELDVSCNRFDWQAQAFFLHAVCKNRVVRTLKVRGKKKGGVREGKGGEMAYALPKNGALRELDVSCNRLYWQAQAFLLHAVCKNRVLRTLKVNIDKERKVKSD